jgi:hypothetical protein
MHSKLTTHLDLQNEPYSSHYSKGKVFKKNLKFTIAPKSLL